MRRLWRRFWRESMRCAALSPYDGQRCYKNKGHRDAHRALAIGKMAIELVPNQWLA